MQRIAVLSFLVLSLFVSCSFYSFAKTKTVPSALLNSSQAKGECVVSAYFYQKGDIPLFLTNGHGAGKSDIIQNIPLRKGVGVKKFNPLADRYSAQITRGVAQEFERLTGKKPYLLIAKIHRSQIDFNRKTDRAYEHPSLKVCYETFHFKARETVKAIKRRWGQGYLLDIHGQSKRPNHLIRGTFNGLTVTQLRQKEGDVYQDETGLFGILANKGYRIMPEFGQREVLYRGGYMVREYGSHHAEGIDAIQFEIGRNYRMKREPREQLIKNLAQALVIRWRGIFK